MEDTVIINALNEQGANHKSPLKPIDELNIKVDKLSLEVRSLKNDLRIILDTIKPKITQTEIATHTRWFW